MSTGTVRENPNFIKMYHGKLEINVPKSLFKGSTVRNDRTRGRKVPSDGLGPLSMVIQICFGRGDQGGQEGYGGHIWNSTPPMEKIQGPAREW